MNRSLGVNFNVVKLHRSILDSWGSLVTQWYGIHLQCRRHRFDPWVGKIPWRRKCQPTPLLLFGKSHGQRGLAGYSPWSQKRVRYNWATKQQQFWTHSVLVHWAVWYPIVFTIDFITLMYVLISGGKSPDPITSFKISLSVLVPLLFYVNFMLTFYIRVFISKQTRQKPRTLICVYWTCTGFIFTLRKTDIFVILSFHPWSWYITVYSEWSCSVVSDSFLTPWTVARQAPLSMGFPKQQQWSGLTFPSPEALPNQGLNPGIPHCRQMLYRLSHQGSHNCI